MSAQITLKSDDREISTELEVCLRINKCFEEEITIEESINSTFRELGGARFNVSFQEIQLRMRTNETIIQFVVSNGNVFMANNVLQRVVTKLQVQFSVLIEILYTNVRDLETVTECHHAEEKKGPFYEQRNKRREKTSHNIQTSVSLCVKKSFDSTKLFEEFIKTAGKGLLFDFKIESITLSAESSQCTLLTETKANAKSLKRMFYNLKLETKLKITCYLQDKETDSMATKKALEDEIRKALLDIETKRKEMLNCHQVKVKKIVEEITSININGQELEMENKFDNIFNRKTALNDKLLELQMQKSEFNDRCHLILKKLQAIDPSTSQKREISHLLKSVGIECNRLNNALPIYARKSEIITQVMSFQVSVILGETGSGKSTQMAQYFYEAGFGKCGLIVCTQPRRVAALSLAERVANEMAERPWGLVGYKAGSSKKYDGYTKILYTTDHALLNECLEDPDLKKYSLIIVDEAHERSIYTDILLGMIKLCLQKRPELRLVITSATIDPRVFKKYFGSGPEFRVSGRNFPVDVSYCEDASDDFENYEKKAVSKAIDIHLNEGPGDILVFLCSPIEIMRCCEEFGKRMSGENNFKCLPLHGQLPPDEHKKAFEKFCGQRKIIFSTNCAETSITIDGIRYVVDTGVSKEMKYDPKRNISQLGICVISQSSADQRKGRAGRTTSGKCYRLYSREGFDAMNSINEPEILRIHLGQAVLKLAELNVNIESYDFVQAPSKAALKSAIQTLEYVGAIFHHRITDTGKWISKLPFDPKLGFFIFESMKVNLLYDSIVLAAVVSTGSDLFYRGFSETEAQIVAKSKGNFGSEYGDTFTWLNIYKKWNEVSKKEKSTWCSSHCLNYKSLSYANQIVQDVKIILSKDLEMEITETFSTDANAIHQLRKILFEANADTLSNFSGINKAGYFSLIPENQVYIHPSSILTVLDLRPEWIVYNGLVRTSKEFIKGITTVEDKWVHELVASGKLHFDLSKAKRQKLSCVYREEVGPSIFRAIIGPRFIHLPALEEDMVKCGMQGSVLNVTKKMCSLDIHSSQPMSPSFLKKLNEIKSSVTEKLMSEESEFTLNKKDPINSSNIRVIIGSGGCVKTILMPNQTNKVLIKTRKEFTSEEDIVSKFKLFGEIKEVRQFENSKSWGFIRYGSVAEAVAAVEGTRQDEFYEGMLMLEEQIPREKSLFEAKLTWLRRPIKGKGMAFIKCNPMDKPLLVGHNVLISGTFSGIEVSKKDVDQLVMFNTGSATEVEIKEEIIRSLACIREHNIKSEELEVSLNREKVLIVPGQEHDKICLITSFIKDYIDEKNFKVQLRKPKQGSIYHFGFISFLDPVKGFRICREISQKLYLDGQKVEVSPCLKTTMCVPKNIKEMCKSHFDKIVLDSKQNNTATFTWKKMKHDFAIEIKSPIPENMVQIRNLLNKVIEGEIVDCSDNAVYGSLLNKAGQEYLHAIERENGCLFITDFKKEKIHLYGSSLNIGKILEKLKSYLAEVKGSKHDLFHMKGNGKPPGLLKLSVARYGLDLDALQEECKLKSVFVNWKNHTVQLLGSDSAVDKAQHILSALEEEAWNITKVTRNISLPECSVCLCPIDTKEYPCRLEICGHAYCMDCMKHQVTFAVNNKEFPLLCAKDGCNSQFVVKDLKFPLSKGWIDEDKLTSMAVNAFVIANNEKYKFCTSPNCPVVYEVTPKQNSSEFICPLCNASICTSCNSAFHQGLTCDMSMSLTKDDQDTLAWIAANPGVKHCPGCQWPIEKTEGCNKMHCSSCHTFFCWICLDTSQSEQDCYRHLHKMHGGID